MTPEYIESVTERYIELYENIAGEKFIKDMADDVTSRIEANVKAFLASISYNFV